MVLALHTDTGLISLSVEFPWRDLVFPSACLTHYVNRCVMGKIITIMILIVYFSTTVFITQRNYIRYMFRLLNSHLQAYTLQLNHRMLFMHWDPSVLTSVKYLSQIMTWLKNFTHWDPDVFLSVKYFSQIMIWLKNFTHWDPSVFTSVKYLSQIMIWLKNFTRWDPSVFLSVKYLNQIMIWLKNFTHWDPSVFLSVKYLSQIMIWLKNFTHWDPVSFYQ